MRVCISSHPKVKFVFSFSEVAATNARKAAAAVCYLIYSQNKMQPHQTIEILSLLILSWASTVLEICNSLPLQTTDKTFSVGREVEQESHRCHGFCFPNVMKSMFPLTLQYYFNAVSHSSALSSPQTALRKTRGIWVVCLVFSYFSQKTDLCHFSRKLSNSPASQLQRLMCHWVLDASAGTCAHCCSLQREYWSVQNLLPTWVTKFIPFPVREARRCWWKSQHRSSPSSRTAVCSLEHLLFARASRLPQEHQLCNLSTQLIALQICLASEITCLCNLILPNVLFRNKSIYHSQIVSFLI